MPYKDIEKRKQRDKEKYWNNRELNLQKSKEYRLKNLDRIQEQERLRSKNRRDKFPNYQRQWMLKRLYNLTLEEYDNLLKLQNNVCAICGRPQKSKVSLHVDHDHKCCPDIKSCGKCIRGLLCYQCNRLIGQMEKHKELFIAAEKYLLRQYFHK